MANHWTWQKLAQNAYRLNPKSRGPKYPYTPRFEFQGFTSGQNRDQKVIVPYKGTNSLLISLKAWGVTQSSLHNVTMLFSNVDIITENPNDSNYFQIQYDGVMYWCKKLDKTRNPLTSRCTCFTGDTKVLLADGTSKTFKELDGQSGFDIISYNQKVDKFEIVKAYNCEKKLENAEIIRVTLDNGKHIDCTPDHRFLTREGNWIEAKDLQINESLRALYMDKYNLKRLLPNGKKQSIKKHKAKANFYVYVYLDPRYPGNYTYKTCSFDYKPIYVGKGTSTRCNSHLYSHKTDKFHNTVRKLCSLNTPPIILRQHINLEEQVAYNIERLLTEEIGLEIEGKGTLLNQRHGGEGGQSKWAGAKTKAKNIENGSYQRTSKRMKESNPMKNTDICKRMVDTYKTLYTEQERSEIASKISHAMPKEDRIKLGKHLAETVKEAVANGTHHTLTKEWKDLCKKNMQERLNNPEKAAYFKKCVSETSKKNWENPEIREKMLSSLKNTNIIKMKKRAEITTTQIEMIIKEYGWFKRDCYIKSSENYSLNMLSDSKYFIVRNCYEKVYGKGCNIKKIENSFKKIINPEYVNHKVIKIEKIENQDVYCLTAEYLGNFIVDTSDNTESNIFSGVVELNCKDFFFTASWYNSKSGCLYGPPPRPYQRKTTTYPERNKLHAPIICKHIYNAWAILRNSGLTIN